MPAREFYVGDLLFIVHRNDFFFIQDMSGDEAFLINPRTGQQLVITERFPTDDLIRIANPYTDWYSLEEPDRVASIEGLTFGLDWIQYGGSLFIKPPSQRIYTSSLLVRFRDGTEREVYQSEMDTTRLDSMPYHRAAPTREETYCGEPSTSMPDLTDLAMGMIEHETRKAHRYAEAADARNRIRRHLHEEPPTPTPVSASKKAEDQPKPSWDGLFLPDDEI